MSLRVHAEYDLPRSWKQFEKFCAGVFQSARRDPALYVEAVGEGNVASNSVVAAAAISDTFEPIPRAFSGQLAHRHFRFVTLG